jgi:hypothetical protein
MDFLKRTVLALILGVVITGFAYAQYSSFEITDQIQSLENITHYEIHSDSMDTLISLLPFEIEVFIDDKNGNRKGASKRRDNQGNYIAALKKGGMGLDRSRMRNASKDPFTLVIFVPSEKGSGQPILRGITTNFNDHFNPTSVSTEVMGNRGIEFRYYFKEGLPDLPNNHQHFLENEGNKSHLVGHICIPTQEICS